MRGKGDEDGEWQIKGGVGKGRRLAGSAVSREGRVSLSSLEGRAGRDFGSG